MVREGELRHARRFLLRLGRKRIGDPDLQIEQQIDAMTDLGRLDRLID